MNKYRIMVNKRWDRRKKQRIDAIKKSNNSKKLKTKKARLLGYLAGDGSVFSYVDKNNRAYYGIAFYPDDEKMAKDFVQIFFEIYGVELKIKKAKNHYIINLKDKVVYKDLKSIASYGSLDWKIPLKFLKTSEMKVEWLKAFFDCKSYVGPRIIQLQSVNQPGLNQVRKLLIKLGIESRIYKYERKQKNWNTNYLLNIMKKSSRTGYLNKIGFNHTKKQRKLEAYAGVAQSGTALDN